MVRLAKDRRSRPPLTGAKALEKIQATANRLSRDPELRSKERKQVSQALSALDGLEGSKKHQRYVHFLQQVRESCGPQGVLLCAVALGRNNVRDMNIGQREALACGLSSLIKNLSARKSDGSKIQRTSEGKHLFCIRPIEAGDKTDDCQPSPRSAPIEETTIQLSSSGSNGEFDTSTAFIEHLVNSDARFLHDDGGPGQEDKKASKNFFLQDGEYTATSLNHQELSYCTALRDWRTDTDLTNTEEIFEHASLEGITAVFDGLICGAIRTLSSPIGGKTHTKASATIVFPPWGGPVDCLLSLDICESKVSALALALFNATVKWAGNSIHVSSGGLTFGTSNPEASIKGASDEAITVVFGSEIQQAITESRFRLKELKEGKLETDCVSMIITDKGAIVSLSLGLSRGLEIKKKLYT